jgi:hypothetical protein
LFADLKQLKRRLEITGTLERSTQPGQLEAATQFFKAVVREETAHLPPNKLSTRYTKLVGRSKEIGQIKNCLRQPELRLLTLTGVGGTGKTTLALAVAGDMLAEFSNGVFFVELAAIAQPELMASTIAHTLGVVEAGGKPALEALKRAFARPASATRAGQLRASLARRRERRGVTHRRTSENPGNQSGSSSPKRRA